MIAGSRGAQCIPSSYDSPPESAEFLGRGIYRHSMYVSKCLYVCTYTHTHTYIHTYIHTLPRIRKFRDRGLGEAKGVSTRAFSRPAECRARCKFRRACVEPLRHMPQVLLKCQSWPPDELLEASAANVTPGFSCLCIMAAGL